MKVGSTLAVTLTGADPAGALTALASAGIRLEKVTYSDPLTVSFLCDRNQGKAVQALCNRRGEEIVIRTGPGLSPEKLTLLKRPVLMLCLILLMGLSLILPTRVLFLRVEGNETIPARQILEAAADCGIGFGTSRKAVRSEKLKNALLSKLPELKWAGINTSGCTAVISVGEREPQEAVPVQSGIGSIVAARDAWLTSCTVTRGHRLCTPGQTVRKGQLLVSGVQDLGLCIRVTQAQGEIYGITRRSLEVKCPEFHRLRREEGELHRRFSLLLGKKRINFWKGSGISPVTCGRMYEEYYITLPGGFRLPVGLGMETCRDTAWEKTPFLPGEELDAYARSLVAGDMAAGRILEESLTRSEEGGVCLSGRFSCEESIGRVITEEIGEANGKTD